MNDKTDQYFEGIVQVRNPHEEAEDMLVNLLQGQLSDIKKVRNGFDYYVKDKERAKNAARKVRDKFGGEYNVAASLHTVDKQTSKELYRLNILLKFPDYQKGEVIETDGKLLLITGLGKKVSGTDLKTGKTVVMNYPEKFRILERKWTRVIKKEPEVEVMHPETYQSVKPMNSVDKELQVDEKVRVITKKSAVWIV